MAVRAGDPARIVGERGSHYHVKDVKDGCVWLFGGRPGHAMARTVSEDRVAKAQFVVGCRACDGVRSVQLCLPV